MNREKIIQACKEKGFYEEEIKKLISVETDKEFLGVLKDNLRWCIYCLPEDIFSEIDWDFKNFSELQWYNLLEKYPDYSMYCRCEKLEFWDLAELLKKQP